VDVLFIHQAFPAQFGHVALELTRRYGWNCRFLVQDLSACPEPTAEMLATLPIDRIPAPPGGRDDGPTPWPQVFASYLETCRRVADVVRSRPDIRPDLVVAHGGRGAPTAFLPDVLDCPIIAYCEYYFANPGGGDISYRVDLPPAPEVAPFFPRCINAPLLVALQNADAGYAATAWQRSTFPEPYRGKIEVHFDGIDTALYRPPGPGERGVPRRLGGRTIDAATKVVTYVARGLESMRGFDLFLRVAARIAAERPDVVFVVAGGDRVHYGWDALATGGATFREWALGRTPGLDPSRMVFLGQVAPGALAGVLARSDLHLYLTVPFVLSWSLFDAMACGCVVLGSDTAPVREAITPGETGLLEPLFDVDRLAAAALRVLADPAAFAPLGAAARRRVAGRYAADVCLPPLRDYFERVAAAGRRIG
jgi:glycosyltransferase involved in cell wall biosynthesis